MGEFLKPRFVGPRFEGGVLPLEIVGDLKVLQDLVVDVAKWQYLKDNPDRQRVPQGFADEVSFNLTGIGKESATPIIDIAFHSRKSPENPEIPGIPGRYEAYYTEAREAVVKAIAAVEREESPADILPEQILARFDRFARRLREDECIEFSASSQKHPVRLTRESRRRLVFASHLNEISQEVSLRGSVPEADQDRLTFHFQPLDGRRISGKVDEEYFEAVLKAFNSYKNGGKVAINGIAKHDREGRIVKLDSIHEIADLDPLDIHVRLHELRELKDGWFDGEGLAPRSDELDWLAEQFERLYPADLPLPHLYPTPEGGVQAEWSLPGYDVNLNLDLVSHEGALFVLFTDSKAYREEPLILSDDSAWGQLAASIRSMAGSLS